MKAVENSGSSLQRHVKPGGGFVCAVRIPQMLVEVLQAQLVHKNCS